MITKAVKFNEECYIQEYFCVCCNNLVARSHLYDLKHLSIIQSSKPGKIEDFDVICAECVKKLRSGRKLF